MRRKTQSCLETNKESGNRNPHKPQMSRTNLENPTKKREKKKKGKKKYIRL